MTQVLNDEHVLDPSQVISGMKQECVYATILFSMMLSAMLTDVFWETTPGILLTCRCYGNLFNLCRLQAFTKVKKIVTRDLLFADDCALNAANKI